MKKRLGPLAAAAITLGLVLVPAAGAHAVTKIGTYDCGARDARIVATSPVDVTLIVDGKRFYHPGPNGRVSYLDTDGKGTAQVRSSGPVSSSITCV